MGADAATARALSPAFYAAPMRVRPAGLDEWPAIWPFRSRIVADGRTYCLPRDTTEEAARAWWVHKSGGSVHVAVDSGGRVLGTAEMHPNHPAGGSHVAKAGFMVDPDAMGRGVGRALATALLDEARGSGFRSMQFNAVAETNVGAVALWSSLGFRIMATVPEAFAHPDQGLVGLHIMFRVL